MIPASSVTIALQAIVQTVFRRLTYSPMDPDRASQEGFPHMDHSLAIVDMCVVQNAQDLLPRIVLVVRRMLL